MYIHVYTYIYIYLLDITLTYFYIILILYYYINLLISYLHYKISSHLNSKNLYSIILLGIVWCYVLPDGGIFLPKLVVSKFLIYIINILIRDRRYFSLLINKIPTFEIRSISSDVTRYVTSYKNIILRHHAYSENYSMYKSYLTANKEIVSRQWLRYWKWTDTCYVIKHSNNNLLQFYQYLDVTGV
jgi:hypothetical protein